MSEVKEEKLDKELRKFGLARRVLAVKELSALSDVAKVTPMVISPIDAAKGSLEHLLTFIKINKSLLRETLEKTGGVLFRGFHVYDSDAFDKVTTGLCNDLESQYLMGTSPRDRIDGKEKVFNSTFAAAELPILPHNEMCYLRSRPKLIFFQSTIPAEKYGETPIFDCRRAYEMLSPTLREELRKREVCYIREFPASRAFFQPPVLRTWKEAFGVDTKQQVDKICEQMGIHFKWTGRKSDYLITENVVPPILSHPTTGQEILNIQLWNRHMYLMEIENLASQQSLIQNWLLRLKIVIGFLLNWIPIKTVWGDNKAPICRDLTREVRDVMWKNSVLFRWQKGDVIMLDNFSMAHGRMNFKGERLTLASFGETITV